MIIGVPREMKSGENRVAVTPSGVKQLVKAGHKVLIETKAGLGSGFSNIQYRKCGAQILTNKRALFKKAALIVKVKEPEPEEFFLLQQNQTLLTFLHWADHKALTKVLLKKNITAFGYEIIETHDGHLPLLVAMSEIAGKLAVIIGSNYLRRDLEGSGALLAEIHSKPQGTITILGAGTVGVSALKLAHGMGAHVNIVDKDIKRLRWIHQHYRRNVHTYLSRATTLQRLLTETDLLIGALHVKGRRAPIIVNKTMVHALRKGSVIVDVAIDQGGCIASSRVTSIQKPTYTYHGITHFCVPNMPSLVPRSATQTLTDHTLPYILKVARWGGLKVIDHDKSLARGLYLAEGKVCHLGLLNEYKRRKPSKVKKGSTR
jgi:alanine dehydrogenase